MAAFLDALTPLVDAFDALGVDYYIGGSVASIAHGVPRTTLDVDVIADIHPHQVRPLVERLQGSFYIQIDELLHSIGAMIIGRRAFGDQPEGFDTPYKVPRIS